MTYRPKRDSTPKIACIRCGVATKRAMIATLMDGEPMCWTCAKKLHKQSSGKLPSVTTGMLVPGHEGRKRR